MTKEIDKVFMFLDSIQIQAADAKMAYITKGLPAHLSGDGFISRLKSIDDQVDDILADIEDKEPSGN